MTDKISPLVTKNKEGFIVKLHKDLYRRGVVDAALAEDKEWAAEEKPCDQYYHVQLQTSALDDVLNWMNYLIYLHKASK